MKVGQMAAAVDPRDKPEDDEKSGVVPKRNAGSKAPGILLFAIRY
jgi:hypothetical protein